MADARFEDGEDGPLRLIARGAEDVVILSSLLQDAVFPMSEMRYDRKARRFALRAGREAGVGSRNTGFASLPLAMARKVTISTASFALE